MASKAVPISTLVLRILTLLLLAASVAVLVTSKFTDFGGTKSTFKDLISYRYVVATAILGFVYTLVQIPFAIYHVCTEKRLIRNGCLPEFDFYGDKLIAFLLATGVGAGFAIGFEFKRIINKAEEAAGVEDSTSSSSSEIKFFDKGNIATGILFLGFLCMAVISILSSINKSNASTSRGFFK